MNNHSVPLILAAGAITYLTRISGFALGARPIPPALEVFLRFVPIAAFAALAAPGLSGTDSELLPRLLGAGLASVAVLKFGRLWLCIAVGMTTFWLSRWLIV